MKDLYIGNLTNNTTDKEILAPLRLDSTIYLRENSLAKTVHRQWEICSVYTFADAPTVYRNSFGAQWTELQEQRPCYSTAYRNDEVTAAW